MCLQSPYERGESEFRELGIATRQIQARQLAIVTSYRFQCCGNITLWTADVEDNNRVYNILFHVWRPSPTEESTCYSQVGQNIFTNLGVTQGLLMATPSPSHEISFQPGDVLGYFIDQGIDREVVLNTSLTSETVWYQSYINYQAIPQTVDTSQLGQTIMAAPLISVSMGKTLWLIKLISLLGRGIAHNDVSFKV